MTARARLVWFRDDLRIADNPSLTTAAEADAPVVCVYVLEETDALRPFGAAARWWLHHSLRALSERLAALGARLVLRRGDPEAIIPALAAEVGADQVFWGRRYGPRQIAVDRRIKAALSEGGVTVRSANANLLYEPWTVKNAESEPYKVFTPFWRACRNLGRPAAPSAEPDRLASPEREPPSDALDDWALTPRGPDWAAGFDALWSPGEEAALERLETFLDEIVVGYADARDRPDGRTTSFLSPHLRWGELSPRQVWAAAQERAERGASSDVEKFLAELGWREFSTSLLFHGPDLAEENWKSAFDAFPWRDDDDDGVRAWKEGRTGYPLVDAGMRQLWRTGWMHNRVRMVVASFLIKHLLVDWRVGERWFWDTLVDADAASNPANWQWVAGSGADASPFFRIFNPVTQSKKFDAEGGYIRAWVPELAGLDAKGIHAPWTLSDNTLSDAGVRLGVDYPTPIVEHGFARERALNGFRQIRGVS